MRKWKKIIAAGSFLLIVSLFAGWTTVALGAQESAAGPGTEQEGQNQTDSAAEAEEGMMLSPHFEVLVGPKEIDPHSGTKALLGVQDTLDLEMLRQFIEGREAAFRENMSAKMTEAGIPPECQNFVHADGFQDESRQILAMTAVFRNYTFYNRIMCQWYADNLWNETCRYQVIGTSRQESAATEILSFVESAADCFGVSGGALGSALSGSTAALEGKYQVTVVMSNRPRTEIYDIDSCTFRIPVEWEGWTEKKRAECEELLAMDETAFHETLVIRQAESLLPSPVPFYKQGAAEWGSQPFGGGTLASDACCPASIAMVLSYFKEERITPAEVAARYDNDACRSREQGSYGGKMCEAAAADYGLSVEAGVASLSGKQIREALQSGAKIVMSMKPGGSGGRYANVYHYVTLAGLTEDGLVIVNNPGIDTDVTYDDMETVLDNQSGRGYGIFRAR